ncbi:MAG: hypothetical protein KKA51_01205 [Nanoarchaeota archaeon]|nr:hypothetical protein [Nanoarchaeota archaeon]MBU1270011.1 hypothetical protein [Nanoarchaeota archaeon]MBU1597318.1 hypothetical protein [Nanoarchaeota archaeon]MBU2443292.1 hypothetical protein [Nanoarchaeota archaeon]
MKKIVVILSESAQEIYSGLGKKNQMIFRSVNNKIEILKEKHVYGQAIRKKLFPKEYKAKYDITNLFRVQLSNFWRMIYTLIASESKEEIIILIIDIINHEEYNKKFGYKKK